MSTEGAAKTRQWPGASHALQTTSAEAWPSGQAPAVPTAAASHSWGCQQPSSFGFGTHPGRGPEAFRSQPWQVYQNQCSAPAPHPRWQGDQMHMEQRTWQASTSQGAFGAPGQLHDTSWHPVHFGQSVPAAEPQLAASRSRPAFLFEQFSDLPVMASQHCATPSQAAWPAAAPQFLPSSQPLPGQLPTQSEGRARLPLFSPSEISEVSEPMGRKRPWSEISFPRPGRVLSTACT